MFNGIIYNQGVITKILKRPKGLNIFVKSNFKLSNKDIGLSVACDGVCLTLISYKSNIMEFYLSKETIDRSKFKFLQIKDILNLELPLKYGTKISGHICQGHVDIVGKVLNISWVVDGANKPVNIICPRSTSCPQLELCGKSPQKSKISWMNEIKDEIIKNKG